MRNTLAALVTGVATALFAATPASAEALRIGFITTTSGPAGILGKHMTDAVNLAMDHLDGRVGGLETRIVFGDDQRKPDVGKQLADEMVSRDRVQFVAGVIWSNVLLAMTPSVTRKDVFMISTNAGPSDLAGRRCNPDFFSTSWQNDQTPEAMGKHLQDEGIQELYVLAPNYAAGKDMVRGVRRYFQGDIVGEIYTKLGQQDYSAEISQIRAANPEAVFVFYPGGMGIQFVKQYAQAGLRDQIPLYSVYTADAATLPAQREAALGNFEARFWSPDLDVPANRRFVADFRAKYGYTPSFYAAQSYDGIMLIDSAVRAVGGDLENRDSLRAAMRKADFDSVRGPFRYGNNHFPIQDFYLLQVVEEDGAHATRIVKTVFESHQDSYAKDCKMAW